MIDSFQISASDRKKLPLILRIIGINHRQEPINRPNGMPVYQWFYCSEGRGELIINGEKRIIEADTGFFISANEGHSYRGLTDDFTLHFLGFEGTICYILLQTLGITESGTYRLHSPEDFCKKLESLYHMTRRDFPGKKYLFSEMLYSILIHLSQNISKLTDYSPDLGNPIVEEIMLELEEHYADNISITEISEKLGKTPEYLCTVFKQNMNSTIVAELTKIRVIHAQHMLIDFPEKKASEIGTLCGFQSPSYFGKIFKKISGVTPNEFRLSKMRG